MDRLTLQLSSPDLEAAKALRSTLILPPKVGSPLLLLSPEKDGCRRVYNPADDTVYETKSDLSGYRFVASSGKWFLVIDSRSKLYIVDVFSDEKIHLPELETFKGTNIKVERVGDDKIRHKTSLSFSAGSDPLPAEDVRGILWVDDKKGGDYVVLWRFETCSYLAFCKKGDDHYREISTRDGLHFTLHGVRYMLLQGYNLHILATRDFTRHLDLSGGPDGFTDLSEDHRRPMWLPLEDELERTEQYKIISTKQSIAVTRSGQVLFVYTYELNSATARDRMFHLYKKDPKDTNPHHTNLVEVHSLGDEALFLDFGTTVPADRTLGIEPNSIYFTRADRIYHRRTLSLDICVFNLTTKTFKRFPSLDGLNIKDAQWFIPS